MLKITLNHAKTHLPLKKAAGSYEQRLQKAVELNEKFYSALKKQFPSGDVPPRTFGKILKETTNSPIKIDIIDSNNIVKGGKAGLSISENMEANGYLVFLPFSRFSGKISMANYRTFLKTSQQFFDQILNPKYLKRQIAVLSGGSNFQELSEFYIKNIEGNTVLTKKALNQYLKGKSAKEKINLLQNFRYILKIQEHESKMDILAEKGSKKLQENHVPEKIKIIEETLAKTISQERAKLKPKA